MAKGQNQKLKLLYLAKILMEETDEKHGLSVAEIIEKLNKQDISAERKAIYLDLEELRRFGMDIDAFNPREELNVDDDLGEVEVPKVAYRLLSRDFELAELKLLVDSVQSAKFISEKKSQELIKKLESLVSRYQARQLQRQVVISGRVKTDNKSVYYSVDAIYDAIGRDRQIRFKYFKWNVKKEMEFGHNGAWYEISPWALIWDDEYYYLLGYDAQSGQMKHYRVDRMLQLGVMKKGRQGRAEFEKIDLATYSRSLFGMFGGNEQDVTLECENWIAPIIIDRFGKDVFLSPMDEGHFRTTVHVNASKNFLGWVVSLGNGVRITGPDFLVNQMKETIRQLAGSYGMDVIE